MCIVYNIIRSNHSVIFFYAVFTSHSLFVCNEINYISMGIVHFNMVIRYRKTLNKKKKIPQTPIIINYYANIARTAITYCPVF